MLIRKSQDMHLFKFDINFIKIHVYYIYRKVLMDWKEKLKHKKIY